MDWMLLQACSGPGTGGDGPFFSRQDNTCDGCAVEWNCCVLVIVSHPLFKCSFFLAVNIILVMGARPNGQLEAAVYLVFITVRVRSHPLFSVCFLSPPLYGVLSRCGVCVRTVKR